MTSPPIPQRFIAALAAAVHEARASCGHPRWDEPGIAATIRQLPHASLVDIGIAMLRAAADPTNETPAAVLQPKNRAWDDDGYPPCPVHAPYRARRLDGECGRCWSDRLGTTDPLPLRRRGTPIPDDARSLIVAALAPTNGGKP